ncbi:DUF6436 domain-containing protein [Saccharospirillum salsuginis]|uniref:DUF6436 domain-containing protein n=1 Tax=Saccharospirillum salsuginis TaxID=418750 RepID=A0A918KSD2_9GAMM|nr:DUF6436 domain-containing protein [Saccharospirillum salsuginis]GGX73980.1 hypothetical protein GCM10007392_46690 [Saccharospirillum salsuginis]
MKPGVFQAYRVAGLAVAILALVSVGVFWFRADQLGWFGETVSDVPAWHDQWQEWVDDRADIDHPAMVHWIPEHCLCRFFMAGHAADLSERAPSLGYAAYQTGEISLSIDLARPLRSTPDFNTPGPLILLTNTDGAIRYLGPYSDGLTCTSANSLVDDWLPLSRSGQAINLDVTSCRCLHNPDEAAESAQTGLN